MADRIVVMQGGRIEQAGTPLDLYDRPANTFVAQFIGSPSMNLFAAQVAAGALVLASGQGSGLAAPPGLADGAAVQIGKRPEDIALGAGGDLTAEVLDIEPTGSETYVLCRFAGAQISVVMRSRPGFQVGDMVQMDLTPGPSHFFDANGARIGD